MLIRHRGASPVIDKSAWVAPTAVVCGDVRLGPNARVMHGAVVTAEGGSIEIGHDTVVMEGAVIRASKRMNTSIGSCVLVGPHAHLSGCTVEDNVFVATRASVFNGARLETHSQVRIGGVVHVNSRLPADTFVPIGWVAVGDPARILPPSAHDEIWAIQKELDFPGTVFGVERAPEGESVMPVVMPRYARSLGHHREDEVIDGRT